MHCFCDRLLKAFNFIPHSIDLEENILSKTHFALEIRHFDFVNIHIAYNVIKRIK